MDTTQIIIAAIAVISPLISYLVARHKSKADLNKLVESNKAEINKLVKNHELELIKIKETHEMEMQLKEKDHAHKLQLMEKEAELLLMSQKEAGINTSTTDITEKFIDSFLSNPTKATNDMAELLKATEQLKQFPFPKKV